MDFVRTRTARCALSSGDGSDAPSVTPEVDSGAVCGPSDTATMRDGSDEFLEEVPAEPPDANGKPSAARILGDHYRSLRDAIEQVPACGPEGDTQRARRAEDLSLAAAFVLRVLNERARAMRSGTGKSEDDLRNVRRALSQMSADAPRLAEVLSLHEFAGLSLPEIAMMLAVDGDDVERDLCEARTRLAARLRE